MLHCIQQFRIWIDNMRKMLYSVQDYRCSILKKLSDTPGTNVPVIRELELGRYKLISV